MIRSKKLSIVLLVLRVLLGGLFVFAAYSKMKPPDPNNPLDNPILTYSMSVEAFHVLPPQLIEAATFTIPWVEMLAGVMLVLGLWTRPAALVIAGLVGAFMWVIMGALNSGNVDLDCGCFGGSALLCPKTGLTMCHFYQDSAMLGVAVVLLLLGSGRFGLDGLTKPRKPINPANLPKAPTAPALTDVEPAKD
jgi:uncharacterized membrane protein YphA (DoxX/SURF4 family)